LMRKSNNQNQKDPEYKPWILDKEKYKYEVERWDESLRNIDRLL